MRFVIIGGSDAGISAALRARELDSSAHITVILADAFPNYSICGLPFYLSGETQDWHQLAHRIEFEGIELLTNHTAQEFNPLTRTVTVMEKEARAKAISYDTLLFATGARPIIPSIPGIDRPGVFPLHTMGDSFRVHRYLEREHPQSAVIVGSGYIGLEMADALTHRGVKITLIGRSKTVLPTVDSSFGRIVEDTLRSHGVRVESDCEVRGIAETGGSLLVHGSRDLAVSAELVLVGVGVQPNTAIGQKAGLRTGLKGAFCVNRRMETNIPGVYAAGDCVDLAQIARSLYVPSARNHFAQTGASCRRKCHGWIARISRLAWNASRKSVRPGDRADRGPRRRGSPSRLSAVHR